MLFMLFPILALVVWLSIFSLKNFWKSILNGITIIIFVNIDFLFIRNRVNLFGLKSLLNLKKKGVILIGERLVHKTDFLWVQN